MKTNPILILFALILRTSTSFSQIVWADAPAVTVLYRNCVNEILIENPDDCNWLPKVEMAEATVIPHKIYPHFFRVIPIGNNGRLTIRDQNNQVQYLDYKVIDPPKPKVHLSINGVPYTPNYVVSKGSKLNIMLQPDSFFSQTCEQDAQYYVRNIEIYGQTEALKPLTRVGGAAKAKFLGTNQIDAPIPIAAQKIAGAKIEISFEICRMDYKGGFHVVESFTGRKSVILIVK